MYPEIVSYNSNTAAQHGIPLSAEFAVPLYAVASKLQQHEIPQCHQTKRRQLNINNNGGYTHTARSRTKKRVS